MGGGPAVRQQIDRRPVEVVVLVLRGLFYQSVDKNVEISLGDAADELIRRRVIKINHGKLQKQSVLCLTRCGSAAGVNKCAARCGLIDARSAA